MFRTRLLSGIVVAALMLLFTWLGGVYLLALLLFVSLSGLYEFYNAVSITDEGKKFNALTVAGYAGTLLYYVLLFFARDLKITLVFTCVVVIVAVMAVYVFTFPKYPSEKVVSAFFGFFYVPVMISFIYHTRCLEDGLYIVWLIFLSSWFCDVFAYITGMLFGKHRLAPVLSPKKSVEGAIGGIVIPAVCAVLYAYLIGKYTGHVIPVVTAAVLTAVGAFVSQIGDLGASAIKRNHDIKDYGNLIPGHGGILDRFDSVIFTAPMIYFIAVLFGNI